MKKAVPWMLFAAGCVAPPSPGDVAGGSQALVSDPNNQVNRKIIDFMAEHLAATDPDELTQAFCVAILDSHINSKLDDSPPAGTPWGQAIRCEGRVRPGSSTKPDQNTIFAIGSVSKTMVGALLAEDVLQNRHCYAEKVINELHGSDFRDDWGDADEWTALAEKKRITLLDLATHYSGLSKNASNIGGGTFSNPYLMENLLGAFMRDRFACAPTDGVFGNESQCDSSAANVILPGMTFSYSNFGVALLSHALTGTPSWRDTVHDQFLTPLDMADTRTFVPVAERPREAAVDPDDTDLPPFDYVAGAGGGGYYSTIHDLTRWLKWHMGKISIRPRSIYLRDSECGDFSDPYPAGTPPPDPVVNEVTRMRRVEIGAGTPSLIGLTWDILLADRGNLRISKAGAMKIGQSFYHSIVAFTVRPDGTRSSGVAVVSLGRTANSLASQILGVLE